MKNPHAQVIDILMNADLDARAILAQIAKTNPSTLVKAHSALYDKPEPKVAMLNDQIRAHYRASQRVSAIKLYRECTGASLMESMRYCDNLMGYVPKFPAEGV